MSSHSMAPASIMQCCCTAAPDGWHSAECSATKLITQHARMCIRSPYQCAAAAAAAITLCRRQSRAQLHQ